MTDDLDATTRLEHAITALTTTTPHVLHRDDNQARRDTDTAHVHHIRYLRHRLTLARDAVDIQRIHCAMRAAGAAHRARRGMLRAELTNTASLLEQLRDAVESSTSSGQGRSAGAYRSPIGLAAADLLHRMRRTVGNHHPDLTAAIHAWATDTTDETATTAEQWLTDARAILEPSRWSEAKAACPACGTLHVWIMEDGERVRKAALQVNLTHGYAQCLAPACGTIWPRERLNHLASVLTHR